MYVTLNANKSPTQFSFVTLIKFFSRYLYRVYISVQEDAEGLKTQESSGDNNEPVNL